MGLDSLSMVDAFVQEHKNQRKGERLRRLEKGLGYAGQLFIDKVWLPAFGHLEYLHPEYEVTDFRDGRRYIDFAYVRPWLKIAIENDGYGPHCRDMSRDEFADERDRQTDLVIDGWKVVRFSVDRIRDQPRACMRRIEHIIGCYLADVERLKGLMLEEREIVRMAIRLARPIEVNDARACLAVTDKTARKWLKSLVLKKMLVPAADLQRVHAYRLTSEQFVMLLE